MPTLEQLALHGKLIRFCWADEPDGAGFDYWKVAIYLYDDKKYIVENNIVNGRIETIIKNFPNY